MPISAVPEASASTAGQQGIDHVAQEMWSTAAMLLGKQDSSCYHLFYNRYKHLFSHQPLIFLLKLITQKHMHANSMFNNNENVIAGELL